MNIRKNIDYTEMYEALDELMSQQLSQMELYWEIGKAVCRRMEKGAAVMASEYLNKHYPDVKGFSPRSLRRIRDFYRTYENYPDLLSRAMKLGWTQNVVIMEAELTMELREWYLKAVNQFGWSKMELMVQIAGHAHEELTLSVEIQTLRANEDAYAVFEKNTRIICNGKKYILLNNGIQQKQIEWSRRQRFLMINKQPYNIPMRC